LGVPALSYLDYFDAFVMEVIVRALYASYDRNVLAFDPEIGNTSMSFGVSTWQSSMYFLEQGFGSVVGAEVHRSGSAFHIKLPNCRISFYKFGSSMKDRAEDFRLNGERSRKRLLIVENNQMSLFNFTMDREAQPVAVPEIVVVHSGNPDEGFLQAWVGAPISSDRAEAGWLWLEQVYTKDNEDFGLSGVHIDPTPPPPSTPTFKDMAQPTVTVEEMPEESTERTREDKA